MANIKTIANIARVSPATVSNVFTKNKRVSEETEKRVLEVCKLYDYIPSIMASGNITKKTNIIGLFLDVGTNTYDDLYAELIKGVAVESAYNNRRVILYLGIKDYNELNSILRPGCQPIDGAILILPQYKDLRIDKLNDAMVPYVTIGNPGYTHNETSFVDSDNVEISYNLTKKLLDFGHTEIAFINYKEGYTVTEDRYKGFEKAMNDYKVSINPQLIINDDITEQVGVNSIQQLINNKIKFSAVIVSMPLVAKGVYSILKRYNFVIGNDISVFSFNRDIYNLEPKLSSANIDYYELGKSATEMLEDILDRNKTDKVNKILNTDINKLDSCGPYNESVNKLFDKIFANI